MKENALDKALNHWSRTKLVFKDLLLPRWCVCVCVCVCLVGAGSGRWEGHSFLSTLELKEQYLLFSSPLSQTQGRSSTVNVPCPYSGVKWVPCPYSGVKWVPCPYSGVKWAPCPYSGVKWAP